ncbi:isocitrate lyase/PEP mutase family protein [Noviherbaspirillum pedocola]|uniref:Isocitrate lyase/PEP mutase family protein n=1 Tax=Noviherbaspirillum pedocola TaxID=2801341 RepID=A0A934WAK5_9BURK|nr:isocitrate lyase/PEP mutase family protein [Noviherbaspirillum pedocola]MBK4739254.1 isocitrate lyase/PEP mutase family protein [Noviherbaspirillum pedocola]
MNKQDRNAVLKALLASKKSIAAPGAYDALSARLVEEAGYDVVYAGSYGTAAAYGMPDVGLLSLDELVAHAKRVVDAVNVPVIADAEGGFHDPANIWRTVRAFEEAGVSAIHIEDHAGGKHTDLPQQLIPLDQMLARLRAALDARRDPNFQIIARTDAIWAQGDIEEAMRRVQAFSELGVDMVFPTGAKLETVDRLRTMTNAKIAVIETPDSEGFSAAGTANLVIYYGFCLYAATRGMSSALRAFKERYSSSDVTSLMEPVTDFENRLGYAEFSERARKYQS